MPSLERDAPRLMCRGMNAAPGDRQGPHVMRCVDDAETDQRPVLTPVTEKGSRPMTLAASTLPLIDT